MSCYIVIWSPLSTAVTRKKSLTKCCKLIRGAWIQLDCWLHTGSCQCTGAMDWTPTLVSPLAPGGQVVRLGGARYWFYIGNVDTTCPCHGLAGTIPVAPDPTFTNAWEQWRPSFQSWKEYSPWLIPNRLDSKSLLSCFAPMVKQQRLHQFL